MAQPARKAGGLYGGIQFSASTFTPSTLDVPSHADEGLSTTPTAAGEPSAPIPLTKPSSTTADDSTVEPPAQEPDAGKSTAGIHLLSDPHRAPY